MGPVTRVVLRPGVTESDVEDASVDLDWVPVGISPATDDRPYRHLWEDEAAGVTVHYVWDQVLAVAYLELEGDDVADVERATRARVPSYRYEELVEELGPASDRRELADAICRVAALRPPEDPAVAARLLATAGVDDVGVRRAFVLAAGYLEWPPLLEAAAGLRTHDPDPDVREDAETVLSALGR